MFRSLIFAVAVSRGSAQTGYPEGKPCSGLDSFEVWGVDQCMACVDPHQNDWFDALGDWNLYLRAKNESTKDVNIMVSDCLKEQELFDTFYSHIVDDCGAEEGQSSFVCTYPYFDKCNLETGGGCPPIIYPSHYNCVAEFTESRQFAKRLQSLCPGTVPAALELTNEAVSEAIEDQEDKEEL